MPDINKRSAEGPPAAEPQARRPPTGSASRVAGGSTMQPPVTRAASAGRGLVRADGAVFGAQQPPASQPGSPRRAGVVAATGDQLDELDDELDGDTGNDDLRMYQEQEQLERDIALGATQQPSGDAEGEVTPCLLYEAECKQLERDNPQQWLKFMRMYRTMRNGDLPAAFDLFQAHAGNGIAVGVGM